jgi:nicotinamidase-related amidase
MSTPSRALLVIDVQNEYVTGDLPIEYPEVQTSLANIGRAMDAARAAGVPVAVVQNFAPAGSPIFARGTPGAELHPVVASRERDHLIVKDLPSAFTGTDLADWLAARQIDTLTVVGYMTHNCDASTINHAVHAGLAVEFLEDATGSVSYENQAGLPARRRFTACSASCCTRALLRWRARSSGLKRCRRASRSNAAISMRRISRPARGRQRPSLPRDP